MVTNGNDDENDYTIEASVSIGLPNEFIKMPMVHELSEEEYFQYSLVYEYKVDLKLLKIIQDYGITYLNENMNLKIEECTTYENTEVYFQY